LRRVVVRRRGRDRVRHASVVERRHGDEVANAAGFFPSATGDEEVDGIVKRGRVDREGEFARVWRWRGFVPTTRHFMVLFCEPRVCSLSELLCV